MILDDIVVERRKQLEREKEALPLDEAVKMAKAEKRPVLDFKQAMMQGKPSVIAEVKKASPSKGLICADFQPVAQAKAYENAGANAISILTEAHYFQGNNKYLEAIRKEVKIPLLRKDFIIDPYQIYHARILGADAVLLIVAILTDAQLAALLKTAKELSLHALVEVHDETELRRALQQDVEMIGINNRDLKTFHVDIKNTGRLMKNIPDDVIAIGESGIQTPEDVKYLYEQGVAGLLIGEQLMRSGNVAGELQRLKGAVQ